MLTFGTFSSFSIVVAYEIRAGASYRRCGNSHLGVGAQWVKHQLIVVHARGESVDDRRGAILVVAEVRER